VESTRPEYDARIIANATQFNIMWKIGPGRFELSAEPTLAQARFNAQLRANMMNKTMRIYAVDGRDGCHVENVEPVPKS